MNFFLMMLVMLQGTAAQLPSAAPSQCPMLDCCDAECCGNGTSYVGGNCIPDSNSSGWDGQFDEMYEEGCAYRMCCEGYCCDPGTVWDNSTSYCVPNATVHPVHPLFPLQNGLVVVTCRADSRIPGDLRYVVGIIDVRDPVCNAPAPVVGGPANWVAPMYHNDEPGRVAWTYSNLGSEVFGLALDDAQPPNIYVLPTYVYDFRNVAPQEVWKLDGTTGAKTVLATLYTGNDANNPYPDKGIGLGQIAYHRGTKNLYVTSFADGWIYRLDADTGDVLSTFDPLLGGVGSAYNAANDTRGMVGLDDRVWGLQVHLLESRLYYGTWANVDEFPFNDRNVANSVWSVQLDATSGDFVAGSEQMEFDLAGTASIRHPISDIAFSSDGKSMMVSEKSIILAHMAGVYRFNGGTGSWTLNANKYQIGTYIPPGGDEQLNSAGGVDFSDCATGDPMCNNGDLVMATGDAIQFQDPTYGSIYGLQILPAGGGSPDDSYGVDLDAEIIDIFDKGGNGDVEVVRSCIQGTM